MPKICERCGKAFRDNFDLNRHNLRKKPCIKNILKNDKSVKKVNKTNKNKVIVLEETEEEQFLKKYFIISWNFYLKYP